MKKTLFWKRSKSLLSEIRRFQGIDESVMTCRYDKIVYMDQHALRVGALICDCSSSEFHVLPRLWLVCTGKTDNSSMARKVVSKTGIENSTVYFDHILNAKWLSYQIQDTLYGMQYLSKIVKILLRPGLGRFCVRMRIRLTRGHELKRLWVFTILECFHIFGTLLYLFVKLFWQVLMVICIQQTF